MRIVPQTNDRCMLHSFAACFGMHPNDLKDRVGKTTHWQEFAQEAREQGFIPMFLDFFPTTVASAEGHAIWSLEKCMLKMAKQLAPHKAVLITESHAVAYENGIIYDSAGQGSVYPFDWEKYRSAIILIPESNQ